MIDQAYLLHALSPLHAGVGSAADVIDLPIARQKATGIPIVPGSSVKGVLREARDPDKDRSDPEQNRFWATFGPETDKAHEHGGAVVIGDARLLALPVRSFKGTFAWVTSPLLLRLAARDMKNDANMPMPEEDKALVAKDSGLLYEDHLYLQDIDITAQMDDETDVWAQELASFLFPNDPQAQSVFTRRFAIVEDEIMTFLWETATQVDTRIRINPETGVVMTGAMWMEESLPPETLLIGLMAADRARRPDLNGWGETSQEVMSVALPEEDTLQFGGKASVGRGRCRILPLTPAASQQEDH